MQRSVFYIILTIAIVFCACGRRPGHVITEQKMVDVLYDIRLAQAIYSNNTQFRDDRQKDALIDGILRKHKITQAELDSSLVWYSDNMEYYMTISDSVTSRLKAQNTRLAELRSSSAANARSSNYLIPPFFYLNEAVPVMAFDIDSNKIESSSHFRLQFDVQGLSKLQSVEASVYFNYKDTLIREHVPVDSNATYVIMKPQLADSLLKNISGYIRLTNRIKGLPANVMLYNISYTDSLSVTDSLDVSIPDVPKNGEAADIVKPELTRPLIDKPVMKEESLAPAKRPTRVVDDVPVIRRNQIDRTLPASKESGARELKKSDEKK